MWIFTMYHCSWQALAWIRDHGLTSDEFAAEVKSEKESAEELNGEDQSAQLEKETEYRTIFEVRLDT